MSYEEKSAWLMGVLAIAVYSVYLAVILGAAGDGPLVDVPYIAPMLWTIGGSIVASIVLHIIVGMFSGRAGTQKDQRDKQIYRFGEYTGQAFLVAGALGALVLAMVEANHFWIANALYLSFVLSAILGSAAKIVAYRRGFQPW